MVNEELGWGPGDQGWPGYCWSGHKAFSMPVNLALSSSVNIG